MAKYDKMLFNNKRARNGIDFLEILQATRERRGFKSLLVHFEEENMKSIKKDYDCSKDSRYPCLMEGQGSGNIYLMLMEGEGIVVYDGLNQISLGEKKQDFLH